MKKLLCILLAAALLCVCLPGCHGAKASQSFQIPETFDTSRNYEITFWAKNDTNLTQVAIYKKAIADFQTLYPNISVNLRLYTDYGRIYNEVITNIATGTTPNVCITYPDHIATYLTGNNTVVPLDALFSHPQYGLGGSALHFDGPTQEEIIPKFLSECVIGENHYAVPYMRSTEACYVNKTYVEKLGYSLPDTLTWDFVWEVSAAATVKDKDGKYIVNGQNALIPFMYKSTDNMMIQMLKQQGANYSSASGDILIFNDTTRELLHAVNDSASIGAFNTFKGTGYPANYLNAGQCIFAVDSTAGATWMGSDAPLIDIPEERLVEFETVVMPIPQYDPEHPQMISQGPSICIFNKEDPQEVLASWLFTQFMLTDDVQIAYSQTEGYAPVTSKAQQNPIYQDYLSRAGEDNEFYYRIKLEATQLLLDNVDNTFTTPVFNGSASLRDAAGQLIEEVKKSARRGDTVDDIYLSELFAQMRALYRLDQTGATSRAPLGAMPAESIFLLGGLGLIWILMAGYVLLQWRQKKKKSKFSSAH